MNVGRALAMEPKVRVAISDRMYFAAGRLHGTASGFLVDKHDDASSRSEAARKASIRSTQSAADPRAVLSGVFAATLGNEDRRRSRMDLGLGIWGGVVSRFYPLEQIRQRGGAFIDRINGRRVLVYVDPEMHIPVALFVESARARMDGTTVRLDGGQVIRSGMLWDARGGRLAVTRPQQLFTRWYGFAATFPAAEVFGQESGN
jgi:hypothetical protein